MSSQVKTQQALEQLFETTDSAAAYAEGFFARVAELFRTLDHQAIAQIVETIEKAWEDNKSLFVIGNGGSAAVASHIANDLCPNALVPGKRGYRAFSLTDNVESVTAIANDAGFENIFSYQLQCDMVEGDVVMALSVSGNSPNILKAIDYANEHGGHTIGISGFDGGKLAQQCRHSVVIPTTRDEYGPVEDIFSNIGHVITGYLAMKRGRKLYH